MTFRGWFLFTMLAALLFPDAGRAEAELAAAPRRVVVVPVREDIAPPLTYLIRRGVKQAMDVNADLLILDMNTNGGELGVTEDIIKIVSQFKGQTATYVNDRAFSAGAFISVGTHKIFMAPQSVIGAAAPMMMTPGGGVADLPKTVEAKMNSAVRALVRRMAEKNGHNVEVIEAMIDPNKELVIDGKVINKKDDILTLTDTEAAREYGQPPRPLLSSGTLPSLDAVVEKLGFAGAQITRVEPTGAERVAFWINSLNWLWLIIGAAGIYIEFKTPGFGLPGIVGISAFAVYFLGSYVAGLSGMEWPLLFVLGLVLVVLELFVFPGTIILGLTGGVLMLVTVLMAMVDRYPGMPALPSLPQLEAPIEDLLYAAIGSVVVILVLARFLPKTPIYATLVTQSVSGGETMKVQAAQQSREVGLEGVALSVLRPGGKAQFGDEILDVVTQGELIEKGARIRIIAHSGHEAIVEPAG